MTAVLSRGEQLLREYVAKALPEWDVEYNLRPEWLLSRKGRRLELDIWFPQLRMALEYQGWQHYVGGLQSVTKQAAEIQRVRDLQKAHKCRAEGVHLFGITWDDLRDGNRLMGLLVQWVGEIQGGASPKLMRVPQMLNVLKAGRGGFNPHGKTTYGFAKPKVTQPKFAKPRGRDGRNTRNNTRIDRGSVAARMGW